MSSLKHNKNLNVLIPMAGLGSRFHKSHPNEHKPFIDVLGKPMIERVIQNFNQIKNINFIFVINKNIPIEKFSNLLNSLNISFDILVLEKITDGPARTCLFVESLINNSNPLFISNCDQIIEDLDIKTFLNFCKKTNCDGALGVFNSNSPKNSYVKLNENFQITNIKEKIVISNIATNGLHFWKHGSDFVQSAKDMISAEEKYNNEFYVAPSFNHLISKNKIILPYYFNMHFPIGTPEDLSKYIKLNENF